MNGRFACVFVLILASLAMPIGPERQPAAASSASRPLVLPIPPGETWYVCQGYNGELTHSGVPALDFSRAKQSAGSKGCMVGSKYSSAGAVVSAPAAGTAYRWPGCCGNDFVCINLDSGGSAAIGHLKDRVPNGTRVATGGRIGSVAWPDSSNGDYAHIHAQVHSSPNCTEGSDPVAFDVAHGFKWSCMPDLPYSGAPNQYSGLAVSRCAEAPVARDGEAGDEEMEVGMGRPSWLAQMIFRSIRLLGVSIVEPA